jgi:Eukaryotic aspartyl protease
MNTISLGFKFGGQLYNFTGIDLIMDNVSNQPGLQGMCLSSIFVLGSVLDNNITGSSGPAWLVGDAFLKNVYSVFRSVDGSFMPITPLPVTTSHLFKPVSGTRPLPQEQ